MVNTKKIKIKDEEILVSDEVYCLISELRELRRVMGLNNG